MRTIETTIYQFDELDEKAKEKARDWYRRASDGDNDFAEFVIDDAGEIATLMGIELKQRPVKTMGGQTRYEPAISWSGFWSQGDGASFEGRYEYKPDCLIAVSAYAPTDEKLHAIARVLQDNGKDLQAIIGRHTSRYSHEMTMAVDVETTEGESALPEAEEALTEAFRDFARWIYRQLEQEYNYQNADEQIDETIRANEYEFTVDGERS